ncbi:MAG: hydantoinase/carbamoylase family amidase [Thermomicrobiales bacterium]|nr:hydantoinase/carbamoylase family amidase [Thermomicrobiales bacterium]
MTTVTERWIDPARIANAIEELAEFGARGETGVARLVYSPEWSAAQDQVAAWMAEAGLRVERDAVGNVWGYLDGAEESGILATGSHIDSQNPGGRFDGALGVVAGIAALRVLSERFGQPQRTLAVVSLVEEEASRFAAANFWGSRAITGGIRTDDPETTIGFGGETIANAMREVGLDPALIPEARRADIDSFVELHIEQGPILEHANLPVAIVTGITGIRHYEIELRGTQNHAGAFPMDLRRDPIAGFSEIASGVIDTAHRWGRPAVSTVGRIHVKPNATAIIPESVTFTLDARHPDPDLCQKLYDTHENFMREVAKRRNLEIKWRIMIDHPACPSDAALVSTLRTAADTQGVPTMLMASGAGHDSQQMAKIAKVAMIFVRSKEGRSHTPDEFSSIEDIVAGIEVLAAGLHRLAY